MGLYLALSSLPAGLGVGSTHNISCCCPSDPAEQRGDGPVSSLQASELCSGQTRAGRLPTRGVQLAFSEFTILTTCPILLPS